MIVGSNHLFEEHIFDMFIKRYKNILKKEKWLKDNFVSFYSVSGNNDMGGRAENSQGQDQGEGEKHDQAKSENDCRNLFWREDQPVHNHGSILPLSSNSSILFVLLDLAWDHRHLPDREHFGQDLNILVIFILNYRRQLLWDEVKK